MPRYEMANKFWDIKLSGSRFTTNFGKIGSPGQTRLKDYPSAAEAKAGYEKAIADKRKEGFALAGGKKPKAAASTPKGDARNVELEKAIVADPYDADAYSVLGDWLQAQADPRGELIALQLAGKHKPAKKLI